MLGSAEMATYGQNFRALRGAVPQEEIARRLKLRRQSNVSAIEVSTKIPTPKNIIKHAQALECQPSELLRDVVTDYDRIRKGEFDDGAGLARASRTESIPVRRPRKSAGGS